MKALLLSEYKKLSVTEFDKPTVGPKDILVQVRACGICGSDLGNRRHHTSQHQIQRQNGYEYNKTPHKFNLCQYLLGSDLMSGVKIPKY